MEKILYISLGSEKALDLKPFEEFYRMFYASSVKESVLMVLKTPEIVATLFDLSEDEEKNRKILSSLFQLNEMMPVFLTNSNDSEKYWVENPNLKVYQDLGDFAKQADRASMNRRRHTRVNWPLSTNYYTLENPDAVKKGEVLSLSAGGAFVRTEEIPSEKVGDQFLYEILFQNEKCLLEGCVKRVEKTQTPETTVGFGVEFLNVGESTRDYLCSLIHHYVLSELLLDMEDDA